MTRKICVLLSFKKYFPFISIVHDFLRKRTQEKTVGTVTRLFLKKITKK